MFRLATENDLTEGRLVIPCANLQTANYFVREGNAQSLKDVEWESFPTSGKFFVVNDEHLEN
jgi:hypothetical protein